MNNIFKMRAINLTKLINEDNKNNSKINQYINPMVIKKPELDVNFHGFADNARRKGGKGFNKSLDKFLTNISFINYDSYNINKKEKELPLLHLTAPVKETITMKLSPILKSTTRNKFFVLSQDNKSKSKTSLLLPAHCGNPLLRM